MTKKYLKYLARLPKQQRLKLALILENIGNLKLKSLDIKKLSGYENLFRCRTGKFRIVFEKGNCYGEIIEIETRGNSYKSKLPK